MSHQNALALSALFVGSLGACSGESTLSGKVMDASTQNDAGNVGDSGSNDASGDATVGDGSIDTQSVDSAYYRAGTRLRPILHRNEDGLELFTGKFFDSLAGYDCYYYDGYCHIEAPLVQLGATFHEDESCMSPKAVAVGSVCDSPGDHPYFVRDGNTLDAFKPVMSDRPYQKVGDDCQPAGDPLDQYFVAGEHLYSIDQAVLSKEYRRLADTDFFTAWLVGEDGSEVLLPSIYVAEREGSSVVDGFNRCDWFMTSGSEAKCVEFVSDFQGVYFDASCQKPVYDHQYAWGPSYTVARIDECPGKVRFYRQTNTLLADEGEEYSYFYNDSQTGCYATGFKSVAVNPLYQFEEISAQEVHGLKYEISKGTSPQRFDFVHGEVRIPHRWIFDGSYCRTSSDNTEPPEKNIRCFPEGTSRQYVSAMDETRFLDDACQEPIPEDQAIAWVEFGFSTSSQIPSCGISQWHTTYNRRPRQSCDEWDYQAYSATLIEGNTSSELDEVCEIRGSEEGELLLSPVPESEIPSLYSFFAK